jgi:hypothetical protein
MGFLYLISQFCERRRQPVRTPVTDEDLTSPPIPRGVVISSFTLRTVIHLVPLITSGAHAGGEGSERRHRRTVPARPRGASHALAIMLAEPGPSLQARGYAWSRPRSRLLTAKPRRRRPPSRFRPGCALAASHSKHLRSAFPDHPAAAVCADRRNSKSLMHQRSQPCAHRVAVLRRELDQWLGG